MSLTRINTNTDAILAGANLKKMELQLTKTLSHLSTGLRIASAVDDPSGTGLMASFNGKLSGNRMAQQNVEDALSLFQTADSALSDNMDILLRMRDLAVRASTDATLTTTQRQSLENEVQRLRSEIGKRKAAVTFNSKGVFSGGLSNVTIFIGPENKAAFKMTIQIPTLSIGNIAGRNLSNIRVSQVTSAQNSIDLLNSAINGLASIQVLIGTQEQALERMLSKLQSEEVNLASAASRISDADMASEITNLSKQQIIAQAATAMVAQANTQSSSVMKLLGIG